MTLWINTPFMHVLVLTLLVVSLLPTSALVLTYNSTNPTNITLKSSYSTLGVTSYYPGVYARVVKVSLQNIDQSNCHINVNITQAIAVFNETSFPNMVGCNSDPVSIKAALARALVDAGAIGVIIPASEKYSNGRVLGFTDTTRDIPIAVIPTSVLNFINDQQALFIQLEPISEEEHALIVNLKKSYTAWIYLDCAFFGILMLYMTYVVTLEMKALRAKGKIMSYSALPKIFGWLDTIVTFLWLAIGPNNFDNKSWWYSRIVANLMFGFGVVVVVLVLRIWLMGLITDRRQIKIWTIIIYILIVMVLVSSLTFGVLWMHVWATNFRNYTLWIVVAFTSVGYIYSGKNIVTILRASKNNRNTQRVSLRIIGFIAIFVLSMYVILIVQTVSPVGIIFGVLMDCTCDAVVMGVTFYGLFFPKTVHQFCKRKKTLPTTLPSNQQNKTENQSTAKEEENKQPTLLDGVQTPNPDTTGPIEMKVVVVAVQQSQ